MLQADTATKAAGIIRVSYWKLAPHLRPHRTREQSDHSPTDSILDFLSFAPPNKSRIESSCDSKSLRFQLDTTTRSFCPRPLDSAHLPPLIGFQLEPTPLGPERPITTRPFA
ncbi:hypothetical protein PGT21_021087 [Puccinia graminis f. sp. tritici]|uniref:Uncharacterized protein n=1 Tax=Puccinia graminis f. sp. tritici TaxID=56615 RepID=A0A5B0NAT6_PUCGR|nr:hypothetical protein PGT21_021087 [Puccinia graminis f. sp. tritici]